MMMVGTEKMTVSKTSMAMTKRSRESLFLYGYVSLIFQTLRIYPMLTSTDEAGKTGPSSVVGP